MKRIIFFLLYTLFLICITFFSYAFIDPNLIYLKHFFTDIAYQQRDIVTFAYTVIITIFFIFYFLIIYWFKKKIFTPKDIKILLALTIGILFFSYPAMVSFDIFNYIATAKITFFYHENPYIIMPIAFIGDPLLLFMHAANKTALYGISWLGLTAIPFFLGFKNFILTMFAFKFFVISFYLGILWIIKKLSKDWSPVLLFAFNPLVIIETLVSGHNDIVMMFFALSSIYILKKKKILMGMLLFLLSVFIKYATLFLLPIIFYIIWKQIKNQEITWGKIYMYSAIFMGIIFFLSPLREEIYPWYAIWFLPFIFLNPTRKTLIGLTIAFCFSLLLRYVPFMLLGTYFGPTPAFKIILTISLPLLFSIYLGIRQLWSRK